MLTAVYKNYRVLARDAQKGFDYKCPACDGEVIPKQGDVKIWHFAHKYLNDCWWETESEEHLHFKLKLYDLFKSLGYECEMEDKLEIEDRKYMLDVSLVKNELKIAIEIQLSRKPIEEVVQKTKDYNKAGYFCFWILGGGNLCLGKDNTTKLLRFIKNNFHQQRVYSITKDVMYRNPNWKDKTLELSVCFYNKIGGTKTLAKKHYLPITDYDIETWTTTKGYKIAGFKQYRGEELKYVKSQYYNS